MSVKFSVSLFLLILMLSAPASRAFHLPEDLLATSRPEKTLAGIYLDRSKLSDVIRLYGEPPCIIKDEHPPKANRTNTYDYYWDVGQVKLHLVTFRPAAVELIAMVGVTGPPTGDAVGSTGSGLVLGEDLSELRRIYGKRFHSRHIPELGIYDVHLQWRGDGCSMTAELDEADKITSLRLFAPE